MNWVISVVTGRPIPLHLYSSIALVIVGRLADMVICRLDRAQFYRSL